MKRRKLFAVVLAAGAGRRFGSTKQLARIGDRTMVARAVSTAEAVCGPRTVLVAGNDSSRVVEAAGLGQGFFVVNDRYAAGLAGSIAAGIRSVAHLADAVLLTLADQPLVTAQHLRCLEDAWRASPGAIVASAYAGTCGPPVIFPSRYFGELASLDGDRGARAVIDAHAGNVLKIGFEAAAVDVDTPEDLDKVQPDAASG